MENSIDGFKYYTEEEQQHFITLGATGDVVRVPIKPNEHYNLFGKVVTGEVLEQLDMSYIHWFDAIVIEISLNMNNRIGAMFHPLVAESLRENGLDSPFAGKGHEGCERALARLESDAEAALNKRRRMAGEVDIASDEMRSKKSRVVSKLVSQKYERSVALDKVNEFLEMFGSKFLNLTIGELAAMVDQYILTGKNPDWIPEMSITDPTKAKLDNPAMKMLAGQPTTERKPKPKSKAKSKAKKASKKSNRKSK